MDRGLYQTPEAAYLFLKKTAKNYDYLFFDTAGSL